MGKNTNGKISNILGIPALFTDDGCRWFFNLFAIAKS